MKQNLPLTAPALIPTPSTLRREKSRLEAAILAEQAMGVSHYDSLAAVTDHILTPFAWALRSEGYQIKTTRGGCLLIGTCPSCRSRELYTVEKPGVQIEICPYCHHQAIAPTGALP